MTTYEDALDRLEKFVKKLPSTNVDFIFFGSDNKLSYRNEFKLCKYDGDSYYISQGKTKNYVYFYRESDIKYLVSVLGKKKTQPVTVFDADVISKGGECNLGSHVTYSVNRQKNGDILILNHNTVYEDESLNGYPTTFRRFEYNCNFYLSINKFDNIDEFKRITCSSKPTKTYKMDIENTYDEPDQKIVYKLTRIVAGIEPISGGAKRPKQPDSIGLPLVEEFIREVFIAKLIEIHEWLPGITAIYDKNRQHYKKHIVLLMEYDDLFMRAYYLDANTVFKASLAYYRKKQGKQAGKRQAQAYASFVESMNKADL